MPYASTEPQPSPGALSAATFIVEKMNETLIEAGHPCYDNNLLKAKQAEAAHHIALRIDKETHHAETLELLNSALRVCAVAKHSPDVDEHSIDGLESKINALIAKLTPAT